MRKLLLVFLIAALPAAADEEPPVAVQFNGYSVTVSAWAGLGIPASDDVAALASDACASAGKTARYQTRRYLGNGQTEYFYLCL